MHGNTVRVGLAILGVLVGAGRAAAQGRPPFAGPPPDYFVDEAKLPFAALPATCTDRHWGIHNGAGYQIEVPCEWDGRLVLFVHGLRNLGEPQDELVVTPPPVPLRDYFVKHGIAWAASSFSKNLNDVKVGVQNTHALGELFGGLFGRPRLTYLVGVSMGSHVAAVMLEQFPTKYDGALLGCGVLGDVEAFDYYLDVGLVAQVLAGLEPQFPEPENYRTEVLPIVRSRLWSSFPQVLTPAGVAFQAAVQHVSGGARPFFPASLRFWADFILTRGYGDGTRLVTVASAVENVDTVYQLDSDPALSPSEEELNALVLRVEATRQGRHPEGLANVPRISGEIRVPVLTLHTIGDLQVPISMEQIYARRVASRGRSELLVQRAIRANPHCGFDALEQTESFLALEEWVENGQRPPGDELLVPAVMADPSFGCNFTRSVRPGIPRCP